VWRSFRENSSCWAAVPSCIGRLIAWSILRLRSSAISRYGRDSPYYEKEKRALVRAKPDDLDHNGEPQVFDNVSALNNGIIGQGNPIRIPYPGEAGERNNFRGDGYFGIDSGVSKSWNVSERHSLKFAWKVFNVTNSVRFDTNPTSFGNKPTTGSLGIYSATLTTPRVQQFSLRYAF
jgi:hypothetical protein